MPLIARFAVESFDQSSIAGVDADWVSTVVFHKVFTSGLTGRATTVFWAAGTEGHRSYVATEQITGATDDGRSGTFLVQHGGLESDPDSSFGHIVPFAGTGDFASWAGSARIRHDADGAYFEIELAEPGPSGT